MNKIHRISSLIKRPILNLRSISAKSGDEWNDAWESAWLPEDLSAKNRAPWEADVNFSLTQDIHVATAPDVDPETKAFVEDMNDNWEQRRRKSGKKKMEEEEQRLLKQKEESRELYSLENVKKDYRLKKQRVHAGLWMKEIEKLEESKFAIDADFADSNDIERLLDTASDIFDSGNSSLNDSKLVHASELKNKPDGWETTSKAQDGNIWEMSQREEDILLQEFERRIAFSKFQIASFIKTHIFSRRRPIDGWKYMIEELGPNARKGKGSVSRLPSVADPSTQPYKEEKIPIPSSLPMKGR